MLGISGNWVLLVGGLLLIVTLIQNPEGVAGTTYRKRQAAKRAKAAASGQRAAPSPPLVPSGSTTMAGEP
jgi:branched-chain amino acid transport system permease protein